MGDAGNFTATALPKFDGDYDHWSLLMENLFKTITQKETAKQLWESMKVKHQGSASVKRAQLQRLRKTFETLEMKAGESVARYFARVMETTNDMPNCGESIDDVKIVEVFEELESRCCMLSSQVPKLISAEKIP